MGLPRAPLLKHWRSTSSCILHKSIARAVVNSLHQTPSSGIRFPPTVLPDSIIHGDFQPDHIDQMIIDNLRTVFNRTTFFTEASALLPHVQPDPQPVEINLPNPTFSHLVPSRRFAKIYGDPPSLCPDPFPLTAEPLYVLQPSNEPGMLFHTPHRVTFAGDANIWEQAPPSGLHISAAERLLLQPPPPPGFETLPSPASPPSSMLHEPLTQSSPTPDELADDFPFVHSPDAVPGVTFGDD
jgi:hypothetical protein